jgi:hypothetical protein
MTADSGPTYLALIKLALIRTPQLVQNGNYGNL